MDMRNARYERIYQLALEAAVKPWGPGWRLLSPEIAQGLVKAAVLDVLNGQDDTISLGTFRNIAEYGAARSAEDFHR